MKEVIAKDLKAGDEVWDLDGVRIGIETKLRFVKFNKAGDALFESVCGLQPYGENHEGYVNFPDTESFYAEDDI